MLPAAGFEPPDPVITRALQTLTNIVPFTVHVLLSSIAQYSPAHNTRTDKTLLSGPHTG